MKNMTICEASTNIKEFTNFVKMKGAKKKVKVKVVYSSHLIFKKYCFKNKN